MSNFKYPFDLAPGTLLANVQWQPFAVGVALQAALSTGITQSGTFPTFNLDVPLPTGTDAVFVFDSTNQDNNYSKAAIQPPWGSDAPPTPTPGTTLTGTNLSQLILEVGELPSFGPKLQMDIRGFINRAIKQIAARKNWTFCHDYIQVTIPAGDSGASMGPTFKELGPEKSPVSLVSINANCGPFPCEVVTRAQLQRGGGWGEWPGGNLPGSQGGEYFNRRVFIEQNADGQWYINVAQPLVSAQTYNISGYFYPPALTLGIDTNGVVSQPELADAVINRAKAIAYSSIDPTDPRGLACQQLYQMHYDIAVREDSYRRIAGVSWHA